MAFDRLHNCKFYATIFHRSKTWQADGSSESWPPHKIGFNSFNPESLYLACGGNCFSLIGARPVSVGIANLGQLDGDMRRFERVPQAVGQRPDRTPEAITSRRYGLASRSRGASN
jgi:hypothetical protein